MLGASPYGLLTTDSGRFGVWDSGVSGRKATDLSQPQAYATAADLDVQYDAHSPRPATAVRRVEPAQLVQRAEWHGGGVLDRRSNGI